MKKIVYIIFIYCSLIACNDNKAQKSNIKIDNKNKINSIKENTKQVDTIIVPKTNEPNLAIYDLDISENNQKDSIAFVSLSDNYILSEHPDSLAIPSLKHKAEKDAQYLNLNSTYRKRFLSKMKISETDTVFIYDYSVSILKTYSVKNLNVIARINDYGANWPYSQFDYMIGFEINAKSLKNSNKYYRYNLVYIGKKSPFIIGQVKPVIWKKIKSKNFLSIPINPEEISQIHQCIKGNAYNYTTKNRQYFIQEFIRDNKVAVRHLLVLELKTKKTICQKIYYDHESASLAPLNLSQFNIDNIDQWAGELFINKPPVIFGFEYVSFGCPSITFVDQSEKDIYINCDNRH
jgi:hypothetical protein